MPIPNEDSIRDRYDRILANLGTVLRIEPCYFCGESDKPLREFHNGYICEDCSAKCPLCNDLLGNEPEQNYMGQRCHKICAEDAIAAEVEAVMSYPLIGGR